MEPKHMQVNFENKNVLKNITNILEQSKDLVLKAEKGKTWDEVNSPLDEIGLNVGLVHGVAAHLNSVQYDAKIADEYEQTLPLISRFYNQLSSNKKLYEAFKNLENTDLNEKEKYILSEGLKGFELGGIHLSARGSTLLAEIDERLSVLQNDFGKNTMMSTNEWSKEVEVEKLKGVSEINLAKFKTDDGYKISLQMPSYLEVMTSVDDRDIREEVYMAFISRASDVGITGSEWDNKVIMDETLRLRREKANLLGFKDYAEMSIYSKMLDDADEGLTFLNKLVDLSKNQAENEFSKLEEFAGLALKPWDLSYYANKLKEQEFGFKKEDVTDYYPENKVMAGLFDLIENLYQVKVVQIEEKTYHKDVKVFEFYEEEDKIGKVYLDPYARENKRGGAWMDDYLGLDDDNKPIAFVVCNFNQEPDGETYFEFGEIVTLFHEFGHALHGMLSNATYESTSGTETPRDFVEFPSQVMENWAMYPTVLNKYAKHYKTGKECINRCKIFACGGLDNRFLIIFCWTPMMITMENDHCK